MKTKSRLQKLAGRTSQLVLLVIVTGLLGSARSLPAASLSELMEKGVYSEETKGDLDAALQIYQQVVAEAKGGAALAAQAQYRVGVCYYKKKNYTEATAAFEKVVKDYPDQKDLVNLANKYLSGAMPLLPAPWVSGEVLRLDVKFPTGFKLGTASYAVTAGESGGQKIWQLESRLFAGVQSFSRVEVEADTFKPIHSRWMHSLIGDADAVYRPGQAEVKLKGKDEIKKCDLEGIVYDNEEVVQLIRRLPLAPGYTTTVRCFTSLGGGAIIPIKLDVSGPEKLEVPAGSFECLKVEMSLKQSFWYSTDPHHYLVKFEAGGILAELASIGVRKADEPVTYQDPALHFSLTAPSGWEFSGQTSADAKRQSVVFVLDPEAIGSSTLKVVQMSAEYRPESSTSVRKWADWDLKNAPKASKDFKVRTDSWKERTVGGHPAVSCLSDFVEGQVAKVVYSVYIFADGTAAMFSFAFPAKEFEGFLPALDAIVDTYKVK